MDSGKPATAPAVAGGTVAPPPRGRHAAQVTKGQHTLTAVAQDAAGNTATSPGVAVTVQ